MQESVLGYQDNTKAPFLNFLACSLDFILMLCVNTVNTHYALFLNSNQKLFAAVFLSERLNKLKRFKSRFDGRPS